MITVKVFKDEKLLRRVTGKSVSVTTVMPAIDGANVKGLCFNEGVDENELLKALASTCADHIVALSDSEDDGCKKAGKFMDGIVMCSVVRLKKKYGNKEEAQDGKLQHNQNPAYVPSKTGRVAHGAEPDQLVQPDAGV